MSEIVCQVSNRENQIEFIWSAGGGYFLPYSVTGAQLGEMREATRMVRKALGEMVCSLNLAGDEPAAWEPSYALAEAGFRLYNYLLPSEGDTARKVRKWLDELRKQTPLDALEIVVEEQSADPRAFLSVPWNLVYDERPAKHKAAFQSRKGVERWRPFWSIRYNLTSGRRVEPLRRMPVWIDPRVIVVVDPEVYGHLEDEQKERLNAFLSETGLAMASSMEELEVALEEGYPRLLYWMGHACPDYLQLGPERIAPSDLRNLLRSFDDRERPEGMLAFLNACQTAEAGEGGSFLDVLHSFGFTGAIATEQQTIDTFANRFGLAFLRGFLQEGRPLGELLHELRLKMAPLGLLYGAHCPPDIYVKIASEGAGETPPEIEEISRLHGIPLHLRALLSPGSVPEPPDLPEQPYRSLSYFDRADRALFTGRDTDIVRFAARLDRSDTRILILHGESGLGKSSFLRAGVIPYLEERCVGYRFLRKADGVVAIIQVATDPIGQITQALLDVTAQPLMYWTPAGETIDLNLRATIDETLASPADFPTLRAALAADIGMFADLLARMAARLPHALVLIIDQAEEIFTLARSHVEIEVRDHALAMIQRVIDLKADVKLIISLRTEYIGRLIDHLRAGRTDLNGVRDDLLRDFSLAALVEAIERPTSESPIGEDLPSPREKYGFRFAEGVPDRIARGVLDLRTEHQDSTLPLIQVICTQLYERMRSQPDSSGVINHEDLDAIRGVEGGLRAFVEGALERTLGLDPPDRDAFKALYARLYSRQVDGTLTTWLASRDVLEGLWNGSAPFAQVVDAAVSVRLLREDALRVEGTEPRPYIRLGHDALAKVAAAWQAERDEEERLKQERAQVEQERKRRRQQVRRLAAGVCIAAGLAALFGVTGAWAWYLKREADRNAHLARRNAEEARRSEEEAKQNLLDLCKGVDNLLTEVAAVDLADIPQMAPVRTLLLDKAHSAYDRLQNVSPHRNEPELLWASARSRGRVGQVLAMLGQYGRAEVAYLDAVKRLEGLAKDHPAGGPSGGDPAREGLGGDILRDLLQTRVGLATLLKDLYRINEAKAQLHQAAECGRAIGGSGDASDCRLLTDIAYQWGVLLEREAGLRGSPLTPDSLEFRESERAYQSAIRAQKAVIAAAERRPRDRVAERDLAQQRARLARFYNNLGRLLWAVGRYQQAGVEFRGALDLVPESEGLPGSRWQSARAAHNLGTLSLSQPGGATGPKAEARAAEAQEFFGKARGRLEKLLEEFPEVPPYREELAEVYLNLGKLEQFLATFNANLGKWEQRRKHHAQAIATLRLAEELTDQLVRDFPAVPKHRLQSATVCRRLAVSLGLQLDLARAKESVLKSIKHLTSLSEVYPDIRIYRHDLSESYLTSANIRLNLGDAEGAARDTEELPHLQPESGNGYTKSATLLIQCAAKVPSAQRDHFYARATEILREGVDAQKVDRSELLKPAYKPLQDREDFQRLLHSPKPPVKG